MFKIELNITLSESAEKTLSAFATAIVSAMAGQTSSGGNTIELSKPIAETKKDDKKPTVSLEMLRSVIAVKKETDPKGIKTILAGFDHKEDAEKTVTKITELKAEDLEDAYKQLNAL